MLKIITHEQYPDYAREFNGAVRHLFPILGFTPAQTDAFIAAYEPQCDGKSCVIEDGNGQRTFCRYAVEHPGEIFIEYLIPSAWENRYALVKDAILHLKHTFLVVQGERLLRMHIDEQVPSHAAYYLGLLPDLGFTLEPRVTMTAARDLARQMLLPPLPPTIHELPYQADDVAAVIDIYARAFTRRKEHELSAAEWTQRRAAEAPYITHVYPSEETVQTWTGLVSAGKLIGGAFGSTDGARMSLDEVFVVPEFQGQGLGRSLTVRCLQKLDAQYGGPGKHFFLGTDRRWDAAFNLYHSLGFTIDTVESYAFLRHNSKSLFQSPQGDET